MCDTTDPSDLVPSGSKELGLERNHTKQPTTLGARTTGAATTTEIATNFHDFSKLPTELRWMIWELTLPEGRVVEVEWSKRTNSLFCPTESAHKPCPMLQTCKESREYYLRQWGPLAPYLSSGSVSRPRISRIAIDIKFPIAYFNPEIDTVYLNYAGTDIRKGGLKALSSISELRNLAIGTQCVIGLGLGVNSPEHTKPYINMFKKLKHLEKLTLVSGDGLDYYGTWKKSCQGTIELRKERRSLDYYIDKMASVFGRASTERLVEINSLAISRGGRDMKKWHKGFRLRVVQEMHGRALGHRVASSSVAL